MAIFAPGKRNRHNKKLGGHGRSVVAALSLTAMVDMFTVLTIFLLQNYNSTGEVLHIPQNVKLPMASATKELKPANVVIVSHDEIMLNKQVVGKYLDVKEQQDWMISNLYTELLKSFREEEIKQKSQLGNQIRNAVKTTDGKEDTSKSYRKITVQADKTIDFLTIKKIMFTVTEAGAAEINFAVIQKADESKKVQ